MVVVPPPLPEQDLVGRDRLLGRLHGLVERVLQGERVTVLVAGQAGIGKSSLLRAAAASAAEGGALTAWGIGLDADGAPGYWPWTQALDSVVRTVGADRARAAAGEDAGLLAAIVPSFGPAPGGDGAERERLLAMDVTSRLLDGLSEDRPVVLLLDDLHWADESSLALFDFLSRAPRPAGVGLIGAYRPDELSPAAQSRLGALASRSEHLHVEGLDIDAVRALTERLTGAPVEPAAAAAIHDRTGGHPFFVRELALLGGDGGPADQVPAAVRDAIERRVARLPGVTVAVLEATAVAGGTLLPDIVAAARQCTAVEVEAAARAAVDAGVLIPTAAGTRFAHDLLRETVLDRVDPARRVALHRAIGAALEARTARGVEVAPSELARHFIAAVPLDGADRAVRWALEASAGDCAAFAFGEGAGHLRRLRTALAEGAVDVDDRQLADILVAEADALSRAGSTVDARGLLRYATDVASRSGDPGRIARVALATAELGARFAVRRDEIVRELDRALEAVTGVDLRWEARLAATLAREWQHSVAEDRPRAGPLSQRALDLGRQTDDPATLLACLLARHDVLWTPGAGGPRVEVAREIVAVAHSAGDQDREAEGLLLLANALLEEGSPAFEAALEACLAILDSQGQPRRRYVADTRRACLALLRGRLDEAEERIDRAAALGEQIREPDTGNVRMSQRLELVRARGNPDELRRFAAEAVTHWTGAPVHAHAVAAGFSARVGDLDGARHHVAAVVELGAWRADRSYLWSVFVRELAWAAAALEDRTLGRELLDELRPLAGSCGVNGAVVAFAGSHAHTAGLLAAALGEPDAGSLLEQAAETYLRLGATGWVAELRAPAVADGGGPGGPGAASMRRKGPVWHVTFEGRHATVAHVKGLTDIARLLAARGAEIHVLDLIDAADRSGPAGAVADRSALDAYRTRLADLEAEADDAARANDPERRAAAEAERQALLDELGRMSDARRRPRQFANHPAERARKAVTGRVRDAIRKLEPPLPELADHLRRTIVTGTYCRYRPESVTWHVDSTSR